MSRSESIPGQPPYGSPDFARWLNGALTLFCGKGFHDDCKGTISTIGIECPCLCECHVQPFEPTDKGSPNDAD